MGYRNILPIGFKALGAFNTIVGIILLLTKGLFQTYMDESFNMVSWFVFTGLVISLGLVLWRLFKIENNPIIVAIPLIIINILVLGFLCLVFYSILFNSTCGGFFPIPPLD